ncbi:MAG: FkbM family methyltransferase [Microscillaceae bacterium]|nr:FkbM family methyltransferase [Microscillaceae bacterium]
MRENYFNNINEHLDFSLEIINRVGVSKQESVIIDVGSANGDTSIMFAKFFPKSIVFSFEPNPNVFPTAIKKTKCYNNVKLHQLALSNLNSEVNFFITNNTWSSSLLDIQSLDTKIKRTEVVKVEVKMLDEVLSDNSLDVLLIKLDTQGTELKILQGAKNTLKRTHFVLCEMANNFTYINGVQYFEIDDFLRNNDFKLIALFPKSCINADEYDALYQKNTLPS